MTKILITGAGGYIGTVLVPALLEAGHFIHAVDRFWFGKELLSDHPRLVIQEKDVRDLSIEDFSSIETVIDLAALSNDPCGETFTRATWQINHMARARTARLARKAGVSQYILASSCSVYGLGEGLLNEESPVQPLTVYAKANLAAERDTLALSGSDFSVTALRLATLFGVSPRMRLDLVVNSMCYNAWRHGEITVSGGGTQIRPLLNVSNLAGIILCLLETDKRRISGEIINTGSPQMNTSINEAAIAIAKHFSATGKNITLRHCGPQDLRSYHVDFGKLERIIGPQPCTSHTDAIPDILCELERSRTDDIRRFYTLDWYCSLGEVLDRH